MDGSIMNNGGVDGDSISYEGGIKRRLMFS
jgi:hypothetical protein